MKATLVIYFYAVPSIDEFAWALRSQLTLQFFSPHLQDFLSFTLFVSQLLSCPEIILLPIPRFAIFLSNNSHFSIVERIANKNKKYCQCHEFGENTIPKSDEQ